ncbi:LuxR family transcriptional regulator [Stutzerimonas stutzeri]|uniref:LuxR family transcriptional regulator n=1 Tax=Stutzerimonas stutzeri TaxID=316 RepID=W8QY26_STUST|nr:response regulator [Stutzerimonas stutzeri]AHL75510.1 LuxR family transcriptional regulator [Stutzerimonas stutzeri]MCQ4327919.1 response regulator [Stutzerimonas stutzeri]
MIRLGEAWVSVERREVFREGASVRLGSRAFDILESLLAAPNRLVTKEELIDAAWPNTVVEENNLQVQISTLRKALGLDRNLLETVPRRGYRLNLLHSVQCGPAATVNASSNTATTPPVTADVHVIDDEPAVRAALVRQLRAAGISATSHASAEAFMRVCNFDAPGCLLLDVRLSEGSGFDLQQELVRRDAPFPILFMTGYGTIELSVRAMKAGAEGFLTKPIGEAQLLDAVREAMSRARLRHAQSLQLTSLRACFATLSEREKQVFLGLIAGQLNKEIAARLSLQEVTVKVHKKHVMTKLGARTLVDLVRVGRVLQLLSDTVPYVQTA